MKAQEADITKMLAATTHLGSENSEIQMMEYIFKRRTDGVHIINLKKTWEKLMLAARAIATIENPEDVFVVSSRPYGQRAVLKFARYIGTSSMAGRYTPGKFFFGLIHKVVKIFCGIFHACFSFFRKW